MARSKRGPLLPSDPEVPLAAYYRVSTEEQGRSGLGLEAQRHDVLAYARRLGKVVSREYTEIETSTKFELDNRPVLQDAIAYCLRSRSVLVIAKLDRLARNLAFVSGIMESKIDFVCCDMPEASSLTIHIMAAVAEQEARMISERTKAGLAAYVARGGKLGRDSFPEGAQLKGARAAASSRRKEARQAYLALEPEIMREAGQGKTYRDIADRLNGAGHRTRTGAKWSPVQVSRVIDRAVKEGGFTLPARSAGRRPFWHQPLEIPEFDPENPGGEFVVGA